MLDALVLELLDKETLDKEQIARVFEPLRIRPHRPAWTGSPDRTPSDRPPVEIPQEIRDRAHNNGTHTGGAVLTPPGSGGDLHDPGLGGGGGAPEPHPPGEGGPA